MKYFSIFTKNGRVDLPIKDEQAREAAAIVKNPLTDVVEKVRELSNLSNQLTKKQELSLGNKVEKITFKDVDGKDMVIDKAWTEAAREASAEARRARATGSRGGTHSVGAKVQVTEGSGVASGKPATVVNPNEIKTDGRGIPTNVEGAYKPVDFKRETPIRYADGKYDTMEHGRLKPEGSPTTQKPAGAPGSFDYKRVPVDSQEAKDLQSQGHKVINTDASSGQATFEIPKVRASSPDDFGSFKETGHTVAAQRALDESKQPGYKGPKVIDATGQGKPIGVRISETTGKPTSVPAPGENKYADKGREIARRIDRERRKKGITPDKRGFIERENS